jgi:hypothetical protein
MAFTRQTRRQVEPGVKLYLAVMLQHKRRIDFAILSDPVDPYG